jgi:MFS transporter, YNFM family, putative membrane transport protein
VVSFVPVRPEPTPAALRREPTPAALRRATAALWVGTIAAYADMYLTQPILPLLSEEFGVGPARAGLTVSAVVLSIAIASGVHGPLSDVLGRRRVMAGSLALLAIPTLGCAFAPSFGALVALRAAQGLLVPGMTAVVVAYAGDLFPARRIPAVVGGIIAASVTGGLIGRLASGLVAEAFGWRAACAVAAGWTLLAALAVSAAPAAPRPAHEPGAFARAWRGMLGHLAEPRLLGAFLVGLSLFFGWIAIFTYLPYHLAAPPYRMSTAGVSWVYGVYMAGVIASPLAGRLAGSMPPRRLIAFGLALAAVSSAATLARPLWAVVAALVMFTVGMFTAQAVAPAFVNASARRNKGGASALYLTFYYVGGALGSALPGLAFARWQWRGVVACSCVSLAGAMVANATLSSAELRPQKLSSNAR